MSATPRFSRFVQYAAGLASLLALIACGTVPDTGSSSPQRMVKADYSLSDTQTHAVFSAAVEPVLSVPSGSVIEVFTHEATGGQFAPGDDGQALAALDMSRVHTLTGPVFVEGAEPGDRLAVELLEIEVGDWGWMALLPGFGLLADEIQASRLETFAINQKTRSFRFREDIEVPLRPFAGVMGVAPATSEALNTIPPRANGGNLDDPSLVAGTTVYFPVFVPGALFSIGDTHAVQGYGEVSGTALEAPMRIVYRISVIKGGRQIEEVQYETDSYYATTGFATTIDEATRKATRYMIAYLMAEKGLSEEEAYMLCSIAGDLKIAEVVDIPHMLVTMHMPKAIFTGR